MANNQDFRKTIRDISLLYELSLSIGRSLDLTSNCAGFLKILMARKDLAFTSVWIKNKHLPGNDENRGASVVYAHPGYRIRESFISLNHPLFQSLRRKKFVSLASSDAGYQKIITEKGIRRGTFALFPLNDLGVLKLFSSTRKERFGKKELNQLARVISKFTVSLEGCLAHQRSRQELIERREIEEALKESEKRFKQIAENAQEWIWEIDETGLYTYASPMVSKILGYRPEEIVGKKYFYDLFHPQERDSLRKAAFEVLFQKRSFLEFVNRNTHKDGRTVWLSTSGVPLLDEEGELMGYRGADTDITARKQTEEALKASEARYRSLFEDSPISLWEEDFSGIKVYLDRLKKKGISDFRRYFEQNPEEVIRCAQKVKVVDVNPATLKMYKANNTEAFRQGLSKVFTKDSYDVFKEELIALVEGKTRFESEALNRTMEGDEKYIRIIINLPPGYEESWAKVLVSIVDLTNLKRAEEGLWESEEKYRSFVERANDGILIIQDGVIKYANPRLAEMSGYSVDELIGSPFTDYVHPDELPNVVEHYRRRMAGDDIESIYETVLKRHDGSRVDTEVNAGIIIYQGKPGDLVIIRDITERKKIEAELVKASKLESLGIMAGGIAHDFNNILTGILGNISLARLESEVGDKLGDRLKDAEKATMRAKNLTQQLLTFSRGGKPVKIISPVTDFMEDVIDFALSGSNVKHSSVIPDNLWPVEADIGQMSQVIDNLILNAIEAMPEGGTITIRAENLTIHQADALPLENGNYVKLSVIDHGIGIKEENIIRVFDPFFTTKHKGSGLGLTSAYSIVKNHDGLITVDSELHRGTTFSVYLPASSRPTVKKEKSRQREFTPRSGRILIVDDEQVVRDVAERIVKLIGYQPDVAAGGKSGIALYKKALKKGAPYDAVLLDLTMPGGMGGKEVAKKIRALDRDAKIIASSGYSTDPIMSGFQKFGFDGALSKPYRISELSGVLEKVIGNQ